MRAAWLEKHGDPDALRIAERPDPAPGPADVLLDVKACALNHLDLWVRKGGRGFPLPIIPGSDMAGIVRSAPAGSPSKAGDEVVVYPGLGCGRCPACEAGDDPLCPDFGLLGAVRDSGLAERAAVPARSCVRKPAHLDFVQAAAVPITYITAWRMLAYRARLRPGEWILVQAAGSGVSTAAIQIARFLGGKVIATSSTPEKLDHARRQGASAVLNYRTDDVPARVKEITGGAGAAVVADHSGQATWEADLACLAKGGRLVFCGATTGPEGKLSIAAVYWKSQSILGSTMGTREDLRTVLDLMDRGYFLPAIDRTYGLGDLVEAHRRLEASSQIGKVVVKI
jgi:NADPH:quinone reductase-like Zn-dependent oxidoreductase